MITSIIIDKEDKRTNKILSLAFKDENYSIVPKREEHFVHSIMRNFGSNFYDLNRENSKDDMFVIETEYNGCFDIDYIIDDNPNDSDQVKNEKAEYKSALVEYIRKIVEHFNSTKMPFKTSCTIDREDPPSYFELDMNDIKPLIVPENGELIKMKEIKEIYNEIAVIDTELKKINPKNFTNKYEESKFQELITKRVNYIKTLNSYFVTIINTFVPIIVDSIKKNSGKDVKFSDIYDICTQFSYEIENNNETKKITKVLQFHDTLNNDINSIRNNLGIK